MKILVIEDDLQLATSMAQALRKNHFVTVAHTGETALEILASHQFELILLDLYLPDLPGIAICNKLRKAKTDIPIIVVTGDNRTATAIQLLNSGADDYLTKPFSIEELRARIQALGRRYRSYSAVPRVIEVGDLALNCSSHTATRRGQDIYLRNKEFAILEQLMLHPNIVVSRANLIDKTWKDKERSWANLIDVHIRYLRDKIDRPFDIHSIQTVYGLGYKLVPQASKEKAHPKSTGSML